MSELTQILDAVAQGDSSVAGKLLPLVYDELRQLAARKMAQELGTQTLQPTALVHEAWQRPVEPQRQCLSETNVLSLGVSVEAERHERLRTFAPADGSLARAQGESGVEGLLPTRRR